LGEILGIAIRPCAVLAVYSFSLGPGMGEVAGRRKDPTGNAYRINGVKGVKGLRNPGPTGKKTVPQAGWLP
jgi:hypothetical protein